jgi:hypothetical protein
MAGRSQDLEKEEAVEGYSRGSTDSSSSSAHEGSPRFAPLKETLSRVSGRSHSGGRRSENQAVNDVGDARDSLAVEGQVSHAIQGEVTRTRTATSLGSQGGRLPEFEVVFEEDDPENPQNWSAWYKGWVIFGLSYSTWVVVFYSTNYTAAIPGLMVEFGFPTPTIPTLGVTTYLIGMAVGSLIVAPMSELFGRKVVYVVCMTIFTILVLPCALAQSLATIIVVRFFG